MLKFSLGQILHHRNGGCLEVLETRDDGNEGRVRFTDRTGLVKEEWQAPLLFTPANGWIFPDNPS